MMSHYHKHNPLVQIVWESYTRVRLLAYVLHHRAAYLEGRGAIDLLLDSGGASSRTGLPSIWDEATNSTCREYVD